MPPRVPLWLARRLRVLPLAIVLALLLRRVTPAWLLALLPFGRRRAAAAAAAPQLEDALYSDFLQLVERGQVDRVVLSADSLMFSTKAGIGYLTDRFSDETLLPMLHAHKVKFGAAKKGVRRFGPYLVLLLPFIYLGLAAYMMLGMKPGGKGKNVGKRQDRQLDEKAKKTFEDAGGVDHAKNELLDIVMFLRDSSRYDKLGALMPKGALLVGASGTGKTLLARAVAGECNLPFFSCSASDFVEVYVGLGASRVRQLFKDARAARPAIVFIDEIDALGGARSGGFGRGGGSGGNDEREQTLNALLTELDGFEAGEGVVLLAATNRPQMLDPVSLAQVHNVQSCWPLSVDFL